MFVQRSTYIICGVLSFVIGMILYKIFIPLLRKVKLGQKILEIGPAWHKSKEGTPNLGGLFFIISTLLAFAVGYIECYFGNRFSCDCSFNSSFFQGLTIVLFALSQGIIGFIDDYVKLFKKRNKGLSASQKLILQFLTAAIFLYVLSTMEHNTIIEFPWGTEVDFGIFYYIIMILVIVYIINCANLTDGIDGLAGSIALIITAMLFLYGINLEIPELDAPSFAIPAVSLFGALLAFLVFNFHPAKIFMGDTGSLFLGGFVVAAIMMTGKEFILLPVSCIWIIEGLSVVIQVISFKLTGKRVFKMSPIHHHFEKCDWSEVKIVGVFSAITVIFCALAYYLLTI